MFDRKSKNLCIWEMEVQSTYQIKCYSRWENLIKQIEIHMNTYYWFIYDDKEKLFSTI